MGAQSILRWYKDKCSLSDNSVAISFACLAYSLHMFLCKVIIDLDQQEKYLDASLYPTFLLPFPISTVVSLSLLYLDKVCFPYIMVESHAFHWCRQSRMSSQNSSRSTVYSTVCSCWKNLFFKMPSWLASKPNSEFVYPIMTYLGLYHQHMKIISLLWILVDPSSANLHSVSWQPIRWWSPLLLIKSLWVWVCW